MTSLRTVHSRLCRVIRIVHVAARHFLAVSRDCDFELSRVGSGGGTGPGVGCLHTNLPSCVAAVHASESLVRRLAAHENRMLNQKRTPQSF